MLFSIIAILISTTGCRPKNCEVESTHAVQVLISLKDGNQGPNGESWPTEVVLLEFENTPKEAALRFDSVSKSEEDNLGLPDVIKVHRSTAFPGEPLVWPLELDPKTEHLVMIAMFRKHVGDGWFHVHRVRGEHRCKSIQHPENTPEPCLYFLLEDYDLVGGAFPPAGFDRSNFRVECAPPVKSVSSRILEVNHG